MILNKTASLLIVKQVLIIVDVTKTLSIQFFQDICKKKHLVTETLVAIELFTHPFPAWYCRLLSRIFVTLWSQFSKH